MKQKSFFFGPEKAQKPCRQASTKPITGLWSRNLNFRLWVPLKASTVIGSRSGCNMQKFLAPAPEWFGRKNTENQCNICTTLKFQVLAPVSVPLLKKFGSTIKNCLGSGSTALSMSSLLVAIWRRWAAQQSKVQFWGCLSLVPHYQEELNLHRIRKNIKCKPAAALLPHDEMLKPS